MLKPSTLHVLGYALTAGFFHTVKEKAQRSPLRADAPCLFGSVVCGLFPPLRA